VKRAALALAAVGMVLVQPGLAANSPGLVPTPIGVSAKFHPRPLSTRVAHRRPVDSLRCERRESPRFGVHLELFARGRAVIVPAGIGIAPPWRVVRPHVLEGVCSYAARTRTPIGVIEVKAGSRRTLGELFDIWGQPLGLRRLAGFRTSAREPVRGYVDGVRWRGSLRAIPLRRHAAIALELGQYVPPHPTFRFGMGL
jgi:hypothetical protein